MITAKPKRAATLYVRIQKVNKDFLKAEHERTGWTEAEVVDMILEEARINSRMSLPTKTKTTHRATARGGKKHAGHAARV